MNWYLAIPLVMFAGLLAQPAFGQTRIHGPDQAKAPDTVRLSELDKSKLVMSRYADCLVKENRRGVNSFLGEYINRDDALQMGSKLAVVDCLYDGELRMSGRVLRGQLFAALYKTEFENPVSLAVGQMVDYRSDLPDDLLPDEAKPADVYVALREFSDCVVTSDTKAIHKLVTTEVVTTSDRTAWDHVQSLLGPCLVEGVELTFSKSVLESLFAESIYRLSSQTQSADAAIPSAVMETQD